MNLVADGSVLTPDDEDIVDEDERAGVSGGGGEWEMFLYAKRTFFALVVV
jgi:hypothetical protein